jgi:heterotetrameric sarcosine oxidase delta subunit
LRIKCPICGDRDNAEFSYLGDAGVRRPADVGATEEWASYVYLRDNPAGRHRELWFHAAGCRLWLEVERDTVTHEIFGVSAARESR